MPLRRQRDYEPVNDWAELRQTLLVMQENIQATIHDSIHEVVEMFQQRDRHRRRSQEGSDEDSGEDDNPFAKDRPRRHGGGDVHQEREYLRWESSFKVEIPEFHGGVRGEDLLDWLVAVEEAMEFKQVPDGRKVALVATKFRGKAASWWLHVKELDYERGKRRYVHGRSCRSC